jgi:hypothetical protein
MKNLKLLIAGLCFGISITACNSSNKSEGETDSTGMDSAVMAPVDTLGGDTTQNSMPDSSATSGVDTTQRNP